MTNPVMTPAIKGDAVSVPSQEAPSYKSGQLTVHHDPATLSRVTRALRSAGKRVVLVPTMGALHQGHLQLVKMAKAKANTVVVVSIFVNPLQFGPNEDLDAYPRTLEADLALLEPQGVELVFAPSAADMYPNGRRTMVHPGDTGEILDGVSRPGHFAGMLTVVLKRSTSSDRMRRTSARRTTSNSSSSTRWPTTSTSTSRSSACRPSARPTGWR